MKVTFKKIENVDLTKVFPVINQEDYSLIAGTKAIITKKEWDKIQKQGFYDVNGYQISKELINCSAEDSDLSQPHQEALDAVKDKFIYAEKPVDILFAGLEARKNVLLWGKGGHGKSEITDLVMDTMLKKGYLKKKPFVQVCGDGLTEEKLYGGMNIKKYKDEGVIEYLPENSFMNHEIVIFEEIFDAPASVLLGLKDIMTSGYFRQGNEIFKLKTKVFIALTNRSKQEFADQDDSLKALAERFPLTLNVKWPSYKKADFRELFKKVHGNKFYEDNAQKMRDLATICEMNNLEGERFISPRTAVVAADIYARGKDLSYISDLDPDIIEKFKTNLRNETEGMAQKDLLSRLNKYINANNLDISDSSNDFMAELEKIEQSFSGSGNDSAQKIEDNVDIKKNKLKYVLSIIDMQNPTEIYYKNFTNLRDRVKKMIKTMDSFDANDVPTSASEETSF
jgi:MoxR-like ATPase